MRELNKEVYFLDNIFSTATFECPPAFIDPTMLLTTKLLTLN